MKKISCLILMILCIFVVYTNFFKDKDTIYVYCDDGVCIHSLHQTLSALNKVTNSKYNIRTINAEQVKQASWVKDASLFVMPGGLDGYYHSNLSGAGNKVIQNYVKSGGKYLGICAGAYYASSSVAFDAIGGIKTFGDRELKFYSEASIGPLAPFDAVYPIGIRAARVKTVFEDVPESTVFYNGGGFFSNIENVENTKILATYENNLPAIVQVDYFKGKVILSGVHFEFDPDTLNQNSEFLTPVLAKLKASKKSREYLVSNIIDLIV